MISFYYYADSLLSDRLLRGQDLEIQVNWSIPIPSSFKSTGNNSNNSTTTQAFVDTLQADTKLQSLVRNIVETNKPMLMAPHTDPLFITPETDMLQMQTYYSQLLDSCCCKEEKTLNDLKLDDMTHCRDTFKCLSASIYCLTRHVPANSETEYFKKMLMDIVMQGGEADTNATVAGALLGARFGYSQLPTEWVVGMKRWEWLEDKVDEFCSLL